MKNLLKNIIISILILIMSIIIYSLFVNSKPIAIAQQEKIKPPMVDTLKLSSKKHFINIKAYGEIVSDRILNIKYRENGKIIKGQKGEQLPTPTEEDVFKILEMEYKTPQERDI